MRYKQNLITAICDTGATVTTMDIHSLSHLTGHSGKSIYEQSEAWIKRGKRCYKANTASGRLDRTINVSLRNVILGGIVFESFYARLNVDSDLWEQNGKIVNGNREVFIEPAILIGLDVIRSGQIQGNEDEINIFNFNYDQYKNVCQNTYEDCLNLFQNIPI